MTALIILSYPVHLHRFPANQYLTSVSVGFGFFFNNASVATKIPGVQMPHWSAAYSMNFCCNGCRVSPSAIPSTVPIDFPSTSTPKTRQEHTSRPSSVTEHAPQSPVPQPSFEPVRFNLSLSASNNVSRGSHRNSTSSPVSYTHLTLPTKRIV